LSKLLEALDRAFPLFEVEDPPIKKGVILDESNNNDQIPQK